MTNEISELFLKQENHKQDEVMHCYFSGKLHKNKHVTGELTLTNPAPFQTQPILNYPNMIGNGRVEATFQNSTFQRSTTAPFYQLFCNVRKTHKTSLHQ